MQSCKQCHYYTGNALLACSLHPAGQDAATCPDFSAMERTSYEQQFPTPVVNPESTNAVENWTPVGFAYVDGELVKRSNTIPQDIG